MLQQMSAAPHLYHELPSAPPALPPLTVLLGNDTEARLRAAESLTENNKHAAALEALQALWNDVHDDAPLAFRHRLAAAWAEMYWAASMKRPHSCLRQTASHSRRISTRPTVRRCSTASAASS